MDTKFIVTEYSIARQRLVKTRFRDNQLEQSIAAQSIHEEQQWDPWRRDLCLVLSQL
jgi:hypothetical protein